MRCLIGIVAVLATTFATVHAQPAPWHKWASRVDGTQVCAQTSPGEGWRHASGPYRDVNCTRPGKPGD